MRRAGLRMALDPLLGAAVAALAADAVAQLELRSTLLGRHVVGMAVEADLRGLSARQPELFRDSSGLVRR